MKTIEHSYQVSKMLEVMNSSIIARGYPDYEEGATYILCMNGKVQTYLN